MPGGTCEPISTGNKEIDFLLLEVLAEKSWAPEYHNWAMRVIVYMATKMASDQRDLLLRAVKGCADFFHGRDKGRFTQLSSRLTADLP